MTRFALWLLNKLAQILEWRNRNYVPPKLTEWEQTREDARLAAAQRAMENSEWRKVIRYINGKG